MIYNLLSKLLIVFLGFFTLSLINKFLKINFIFQNIDNLFYLTITLTIIYELILIKKGNYTPEKIEEEKIKKDFSEFITSEQKTKLKEMFRVMDFYNSYEDKEFNILELQNKTETKKIYDNIKEITNDELIIIENKSGFIDFKKYVDNMEKIKHYLGINEDSIIKIYKHENNSIIIDLFDRFPKNYVFSSKTHLKENNLFIGINEFGKNIFVEIKNFTHLLISGASGGGKSIFLYQLLNGLIFNINTVKNIYLVDFKGGISFLRFLKVSNKIKVATNLDELYTMLKEIDKINKDRLKELANSEEENDKIEIDPIFLIFDEYAEFNDSCPNSSVDKTGYLKFQEMLTIMESLGQTARSQNIKLVLCLQKSEGNTISTKLRSNLQSRLLLKSKDIQSITMTLGGMEPVEELGVNPKKFNYGRHIFLEDSPKGVKYHYLQAPFVDKDEYKRTMKLVGLEPISKKSINLSKNDEDNLNDTEDKEEVILPPEPLKMTIKDNITHEDNVKLRSELWKQSETIEDKDTKSLVRSRLTKINTIIKTGNYDLDKINNDLKVVEKII